MKVRIGYGGKKEVVEHKKKKVWPIVVLMLIIGLALGIGGSYVYLEVMDNKTNSSTVKDNNSKQDTKTDYDKNQITDISVDSVYVNNLISQYDLYVVGGYELIDIYYRKDKTVISDLSENYLRALVMKNERCQFSHQNCYVTGDQFQKRAKMLYGNQVKLDNKSWSGTSCVELVINYNNTTNIYQPAEQSGACGGTSIYFFQRDVIAATKSADKLEVTIAYVIVNGKLMRLLRIMKRENL
ncbi:MAG: hypothetical protein J6B87_06720 [Clostridia bacterium]|nr:hypothetical protein [Clostridia bacterium]